ncbi:hypothetical protein FA95DRAFT_1576688 [Auriscalpium vulgare]|uniref:Uncharacterized protein n=1 Tax=Auriscalpium vulgare TaxID=40419 RepID=A0ACB8R9X4_9AGAM|nr:hypothetical protein FA95DRAFT_1576688 [Auriscalpium vulgare]
MLKLKRIVKKALDQSRESKSGSPLTISSTVDLTLRGSYHEAEISSYAPYQHDNRSWIGDETVVNGHDEWADDASDFDDSGRFGETDSIALHRKRHASASWLYAQPASSSDSFMGDVDIGYLNNRNLRYTDRYPLADSAALHRELATVGVVGSVARDSGRVRLRTQSAFQPRPSNEPVRVETSVTFHQRQAGDVSVHTRVHQGGSSVAHTVRVPGTNRNKALPPPPSASAVAKRAIARPRPRGGDPTYQGFNGYVSPPQSPSANAMFVFPAIPADRPDSIASSRSSYSAAPLPSPRSPTSPKSPGGSHSTSGYDRRSRSNHSSVHDTSSRSSYSAASSLYPKSSTSTASFGGSHYPGSTSGSDHRSRYSSKQSSVREY